jgi:hydrogenase expression/formation protein HypC
MCLAVPGKIISITGDDPLTRTGRVNFGGIIKDVNFAYVPDAKVGEYVVVHVGFALNTVDAAEANQVFEYLRQMGELAELEEIERAEKPERRDAGVTQ